MSRWRLRPAALATLRSRRARWVRWWELEFIFGSGMRLSRSTRSLWATVAFPKHSHHTAPASFLIPILLLVVTGLSLIGIWAASRAERLFGKKDPSEVVIDEVVGQLIAFAFLPLFPSALAIVIGFILFRAFDMIKPYPIRKLEKLPSGLGIVVDDIAAGLYAGIALSVISMLRLHVLPWLR